MIEEKAFKDAIGLCIGLERQWLYLQRVLRQDLDRDSSLQLLQGILMLMESLERSDTKVKLLQELMSAQDRAEVTENAGGIDTATKSTVQAKCEEIAKKLAKGPRILSRPLTAEPFLAKFFYKEASIYDAPFSDTWRSQKPEEIKLQVQYWLHHLEPVWQAVEMILWLVRSSASFTDIHIESGFFRDGNCPELLKLALVRVQYDEAYIYPVVTIAHRWLVITLYEGKWVDGSYKLSQSNVSLNASIAICR